MLNYLEINMPKGGKGKTRSKKDKKSEIKDDDSKDDAYMYRWFKPSRRLGSGGVLRRTAALGRLIKWPKYVRIQRQRKILLQRIVIPPALNMFRNTASKALAKSVVELFSKYKPETKKEKLERLRALAAKQANNEVIPDKKPIITQYGFNNVTNLIESRKAKIVIIAHGMFTHHILLFIYNI